MLRKSQPTLDVSNLYYTAVSRHGSEDPTYSNFKLTYLLALEQFDEVIFFFILSQIQAGGLFYTM